MSIEAYKLFLASKRQLAKLGGFAPTWIPKEAFDFQADRIDWSCRKGRSLIMASCGLGKSLMELVWGQNVVERTNRHVLLLTPLAVGPQMVREGEKFGIPAVHSRDGALPSSPHVIVTNYERLHYFNPNDFAGALCDEAGILKSFDAKTKDDIVEFMRTIQYRLLATATAAPNDYVELGNHAECLGEMGFQDMVSMFFKKETSKDHLGWGRTKYRMRGHAEKDFWRWVCSWACALRQPSDLGFSDDQFVLPPLEIEEHMIRATTPREGLLFDMPAITLPEQAEERRRTIPERCGRAADLIAKQNGPSIAWCHLNAEGDELARIIPNSEQVSGSTKEERKEEIFAAFADGHLDTLVTKGDIAAWGLNFHVCSHQTMFPSHSYEQYHQMVRRSWRFGQKNKVKVDLVTSEGQQGVVANMKIKSDKADNMFEQIVRLMNDPNYIEISPFTQK